MKSLPLVGGLAALVLAGSALAASSISAIEPATANITTGGSVNFVVKGDFDGTLCGLVVKFADGGKDQQIRVRDKEKFPLNIPRQFAKPGTYKIVAEGGTVGAALACVGKAEATVVVTDPPPAPAKAAAAPVAAPAAAGPSCPDGYALIANSVKAKTGEFTCVAKAPATKLACAPGTNYFERTGTVGCRKGK